MKKDEVKQLLIAILWRLYNRQFNSIHEEDLLKTLSVGEIQEAIYSYPGEMTLPPEKALDALYLYGEDGQEARRVDFELWFNNSPSDLTISLTVYKTGGYTIQNIHVL